ncbi:DUF262 domain-containing protein [Croceivirga sp. JEA036]|uniref:DUF262 domain-containing protein n=1 Tax=Croceivirga sp. JEA036 TaxID=2721162 RepID=UPI00143AD7A8|nr:DUF262 domain-containing protein [Croceivirga sp. JEA036]NJB35319.1 DUF262 domain-containing protein [Croceivirga sp. JEA036]
MSYNIQRTTFKVSDFVGWFKTDSLILNPNFQRRSVWNSKSKSYLIDTIIKGLPIPVIILRDVKTNLKSYIPQKEVVDGQQRLRTVISYVLNEFDKNEEFKLSKTHNKKYGGKDFNSLPDEAKQTILDYEFFVHVLPSTVTNREILEIFSRMNSTGVKLNDQELRNASYYGEFKSLAFSLGNEFYDYWIKWGVFTDKKISRMDEVEFVNDLLILAINGIEKRTPVSISKYYEDYDEEDSIPNKEVIVKRIKNIMSFLDDSVGSLFNKSEFKKTPLLYSLFANIYKTEFDKNIKDTKVSLNKKNFKQKFEVTSNLIESSRNEWKNDKVVTSVPEKVYDAFARGTNAKENRETVYSFLNKQLF